MHGEADPSAFLPPEERLLQPSREGAALSRSSTPSSSSFHNLTNLGQLHQVHVRSPGSPGRFRSLLRCGFRDLLLPLLRV